MDAGSVVRIVSLVLSVGLVSWSSLRVAVSFAEGFDQYWLGVTTGYLQITVLSLLTSAVQMLMWETFLLGQIVIGGIVFATTDSSVWAAVEKVSARGVCSIKTASRLSQVLVALTSVILLFSLVTRVMVPLTNGDGLAYLAPRAPYWLQQSAVGIYPIQDNIQVVSTSFGSDYLFMWGIMFSHSEVIGRLFYWLTFPLAVGGLYTILSLFEYASEVKLIGIALFVTTPIVWATAVFLQPLIWVTLFAFGAGYWLLQDSTESTIMFALMIGLAVSAKQQSLAMISGGLLVMTLRSVRRRRIGSVALFVVSLIVTVVLTGYVLIPLRNVTHFGSFVHPGITENAGGTVGLYPVYVKVVRLGFILSRFPVPITPLNEIVTQFGQSLLEALGAGARLPGNNSQTYHFWLPRFPREGFGLLGIITLLTTPYFLSQLIERFRTSGVTSVLLSDKQVHYALLASSLLFGPLVVLEVSSTGYSAQSYLAPGVLLFFPLLAKAVERARETERLYTVLGTVVVLYLVFFAAFAGNRAIDNTMATGGSIEMIDHTDPDQFQPAVDKPNPFVCPHPLVDEHVSSDGTLLVTSTMKYYLLFGENYQREVVPVERTVTSTEFATLQREHPDAYLYLTSDHESAKANRATIENATGTIRVDSQTATCRGTNRTMWLYRFADDR